MTKTSITDIADQLEELAEAFGDSASHLMLDSDPVAVAEMIAEDQGKLRKVIKALRKLDKATAPTVRIARPE